MQTPKTSKLISISAYLLIILSGQMIGVPFFMWLLFTMLDFGNVNQPYALLAVIGLTIIFVTLNRKKTSSILLLDIVSLLLMISPIAKRMTAVNINLFNHWAFIVPSTVFIVFYLISLGFTVRQYSR
jgi:hypothetical protein